MTQFTLIRGDCITEMSKLPANSVDSIVTDPPYELGFMGKAWDATGIANNVAMWREALRVLKPGGQLLAFGGSRTYHRMACAIEDAGFEVRDQIMWIYGSGFPKSLDVSKAIDKAAGAAREVIGANPHARPSDGQTFVNMGAKGHDPFITIPATDAAKEWDGWGTALKPAHEPICVARKPLIGTVAANVLQHGTGAINIGACRVVGGEDYGRSAARSDGVRSGYIGDVFGGEADKVGEYASELGRWPANIIHDGSDEVAALFPSVGGGDKRGQCDGRRTGGFGDIGAANGDSKPNAAVYADTGSAARFFYCAKASRADRNEGCDALPQKVGGMVSNTSGQHMTRRDDEYEAKPLGNHHPTVKPTDLMAYLCRLVTPPGGTVLDPFMGSGSTGKAAMREGFKFIGIDLGEDYVAIARTRIEHELAQPVQLGMFA